MIKTAQFISPYTNRVVNNHTVATRTENDKIVLSSYGVRVARIEYKQNNNIVDRIIELDPKWEYSKTTTKYVNQFLYSYAQIYELNKSKTQELINSGKFILRDL